MATPARSRSKAKPVFFTTRWTMVGRAKGESPEARAALGELCEAYWNPVFLFLRREGRSEDASKELTQAFFAKLLTGAGIGEVDPTKGRFRSYLCGALKHFIINHTRDANREKRGGDAIVESIDGDGSETSPGLQLADPRADMGDAWFDRHWALAVMERGLDRVRESYEQAGKHEQFKLLSPWLTGEPEGITQPQAGEQLGMSHAAVKVAIHRLRQRFGEAIRKEIADTVDSEEEVADELRYLIEVLSANAQGALG